MKLGEFYAYFFNWYQGFMKDGSDEDMTSYTNFNRI